MSKPLHHKLIKSSLSPFFLKELWIGDHDNVNWARRYFAFNWLLWLSLAAFISSMIEFYVFDLDQIQVYGVVLFTLMISTMDVLFKHKLVRHRVVKTESEYRFQSSEPYFFVFRIWDDISSIKNLCYSDQDAKKWINEVNLHRKCFLEVAKREKEESLSKFNYIVING